MSEDLTKKLNTSDGDAILTAIKSLDSHVRRSIDNLVTWVGSIDSRLKRLEQLVEERLYDTRPMWQSVEADIAQLQAGQSGLSSEVRDAVRKFNLEFHAIDERLHRLEIDRER